MPRITEPAELTPFAMVLTDYMWNRRPAHRQPMTTPQLAVRLSIPRQSVNNWIYKGNVPPLETVLAVLAQLDIPHSALYDAYRNAGLSVPRWNERDTRGPQLIQGSVETRTRKQTTIPIENAPEPRPYIPPTGTPESRQQDAWDAMIAQTIHTLRAEGVNEEIIAAMVAHILRKQSGTPSLTEQHISAEYQELPASPESPESPPDQSQQTPATNRRKNNQPASE
jgi:hypothetical protein